MKIYETSLCFYKNWLVVTNRNKKSLQVFMEECLLVCKAHSLLEMLLCIEYSNSKFSQNTTNLLSKWLHVSTRVIIRPIIESCLRYIK